VPEFLTKGGGFLMRVSCESFLHVKFLAEGSLFRVLDSADHGATRSGTGGSERRRHCGCFCG